MEVAGPHGVLEHHGAKGPVRRAPPLVVPIGGADLLRCLCGSFRPARHSSQIGDVSLGLESFGVSVGARGAQEMQESFGTQHRCGICGAAKRLGHHPETAGNLGRTGWLVRVEVQLHQKPRFFGQIFQRLLWKVGEVLPCENAGKANQKLVQSHGGHVDLDCLNPICTNVLSRLRAGGHCLNLDPLPVGTACAASQFSAGVF